MVGSAILRRLARLDGIEIITRERQELDLFNQREVDFFFQQEKIEQVYLAAAKVGGIYANSMRPADFIYQNLMIQNNVIHSAFKHGIKRLLFMGSSCIYPKKAKIPIDEKELLNGYLEKSNEAYAVAKIAGIKTCESYNKQFGTDFRAVMPTNLFGRGDNYHDKNSHVIPGLIQRIHKAKLVNSPSVIVWGSGKPKRDFLYVDDMADACVHVMQISKNRFIETFTNENHCQHVNIGSGKQITISDLAILISKVIGYEGDLLFDTTKPDGTMEKLLDNSKINAMGWHPKIKIQDGLKMAYECYASEFAKERN